MLLSSAREFPPSPAAGLGARRVRILEDLSEVLFTFH